MRVGVISHTLGGRGGIERTVELQVRALRTRGHDVALLSGPTLGNGWLARAVSAGTLALLPSRRLGDCDVLLAHYPPAPQVAHRTGRPYVHFLHHPLRAAYPTSTQRQRARYRVWSAMGATLMSVDAAGVRGAARVAVPSPSVAREVERIYGVTPTVLPIGVDLQQLQPGGGDRHGPLLMRAADFRCLRMSAGRKSRTNAWTSPSTSPVNSIVLCISSEGPARMWWTTLMLFGAAI